MLVLLVNDYQRAIVEEWEGSARQRPASLYCTPYWTLTKSKVLMTWPHQLPILQLRLQVFSSIGLLYRSRRSILQPARTKPCKMPMWANKNSVATTTQEAIALEYLEKQEAFATGHLDIIWGTDPTWHVLLIQRLAECQFVASNPTTSSIKVTISNQAAYANTLPRTPDVPELEQTRDFGIMKNVQDSRYVLTVIHGGLNFNTSPLQRKKPPSFCTKWPENAEMRLREWLETCQ